jgi:gluconolactonase
MSPNGPEVIEAVPFARLPADHRRGDRDCPWAQEVLGVDRVDAFLEGPAFGADGTLYVSDLAHGRIFRVDGAGAFTVVADYDGEPNGLAVHPDGSLFIADYRLGLLRMAPGDQPRPVVTRYRLEPFLGLSDLVFGMDGTLYFTDQGQSDLRRPIGRVFRYRPEYGLDILMEGIPSPNGLALSPPGDVLYVAVTRANAIYRLPLRSNGDVGKVGVHIHLSGGSGGPDGLACDSQGGLAVAHYGLGRVWLFDDRGLPAGFVETPTGLGTTNIAFGTRHDRRLFITEASTSTVLTAEVSLGGAALYASLTPTRPSQ